MGCNWLIRKLALFFYKDPEKMNLVTEITKIDENTFKSRSWSNNGRVTNEYRIEKGTPAKFKFGGLKDAEVCKTSTIIGHNLFATDNLFSLSSLYPSKIGITKWNLDLILPFDSTGDCFAGIEKLRKTK